MWNLQCGPPCRSGSQTKLPDASCIEDAESMEHLFPERVVAVHRVGGAVVRRIVGCFESLLVEFALPVFHCILNGMFFSNEITVDRLDAILTRYMFQNYNFVDRFTVDEI